MMAVEPAPFRIQNMEIIKWQLTVFQVDSPFSTNLLQSTKKKFVPTLAHRHFFSFVALVRLLDHHIIMRDLFSFYYSEEINGKREKMALRALLTQIVMHTTIINHNVNEFNR